MTSWRVARASLGLGVRMVLAYRLEVAVQIASAALVTVLNWSLWTAILEGRDAVAGRSGPEMTTYVVVAWILTTFYGTRVDQLIAHRVRTGEIAAELLRPWSLHAHLYLRDLGRAGASLLFSTLPLAVLAVVALPLRLPERPLTWLLLIPALWLAHALSFGLAWLVGMAAFRLRSATGLAHLKAATLALLSGALVPLDIYPEPLRSIALWLPFQGLSHFPADLFVERLALGELWRPFALQVGWVVALWLLGRAAWRGGTRAIVIQGG